MILEFPTKPRNRAERVLLERLVEIGTRPRAGLDGSAPQPMSESEARAMAIRFLAGVRRELGQ